MDAAFVGKAPSALDQGEVLCRIGKSRLFLFEPHRQMLLRCPFDPCTTVRAGTLHAGPSPLSLHTSRTGTVQPKQHIIQFNLSTLTPTFIGLVALALPACVGSDDIDDDVSTPNGKNPLGFVSMDASVPPSSADGGHAPDASRDSGSWILGTGAISGPRNESFFVSVNGLGTGCPRGTSDASISPDGKKITVSFLMFEAIVDRNKSVDVKTCQLGIKIKSPKGLSFSVVDFRYDGYAYLEKGQSARALTKYYFQGQPAANQREARTDLVGPFDDSFLFQDFSGIGESIWSPCGVERDLQINMTVRIQNAPQKRGDGYINIGSAQVLRLNWRSCK